MKNAANAVHNLGEQEQQGDVEKAAVIISGFPIAANMLPPPIIAAMSRQENWCVLPPEQGFSIPLIGWRLMKNTEFGWVQHLDGNQIVMERLAAEMNKQEKKPAQTPPTPSFAEGKLGDTLDKQTPETPAVTAQNEGQQQQPTA